METRIKSRRWWLNSLERFVTVTSATSRSSARTYPPANSGEVCFCAASAGGETGRCTPGLRDDKDRSRSSCYECPRTCTIRTCARARDVYRENIFPPGQLCPTTTEHNRKSRGVIFDAFRCNCQLPTVYGLANGTRECVRSSRRSDNAAVIQQRISTMQQQLEY